MINLQQWESEFFSRRIAVLDKPIDEVTDEAIEEEFRKHQLDVLVAKLTLKESTQVIELLELAFTYSATNIRYVKDLELDDMCGSLQINEREIRMATEDDMDDLQTLVTSMFKETRFSRFPFSSEDGSRFYREWIKKAVLGTYDDFCVVSSRGGSIAGFYTLAIKDEGAKIGLIGVAPLHQDRGVGTQLMSAACIHCLKTKIKVLQVVTQLQNVGANSLYHRSGFIPVDGVHYFNRVRNLRGESGYRKEG